MKKSIMVISIMLAGCATDPGWHWARQGSDAQQFYMDDGQCKAQSLSVSNPTLFQVAMIHNNCMFGKGWYKVNNQ